MFNRFTDSFTLEKINNASYLEIHINYISQKIGEKQYFCLFDFRGNQFI